MKCDRYLKLVSTVSLEAYQLLSVAELVAEFEEIVSLGNLFDEKEELRVRVLIAHVRTAFNITDRGQFNVNAK